MENELNFLETRINALIARLTELSTQNQRLSESLTAALKEKAVLLAKNDSLEQELQMQMSSLSQLTQEKNSLLELMEQTADRVENLIGRLPKAEEAQL